MNSLEQVLEASQPSANRSPPREQHWDSLLVVTIPFTKLGGKVFLLHVRTKNDPESPKHVKEQVGKGGRSESAGINRHRVGDERALHERSS